MTTLMMNVSSSSKELKNVRSLVLCGILLAVKIVLATYFTLRLGPTLKIGTSFIASATIGFLFGPVVGAVSGGVSDIISFMMFPDGSFNIVFTLISTIAGSIYGFLLYNKKITIFRCLITEFILIVFINLLLNTAAISTMYGTPFFALLPARLVKNIVQFPINTVIMYVVLIQVEKLRDKGLIKK